MKPTFLGIGSQRCASTWLFNILKTHPEIYLSEPKELNFFSRTILSQSIEDYFSNFEQPEAQNPKKIRGEISPHYARLSINRIKSIAKLIPDLKIILLIRNPLKRAWSGICYEMGGILYKDKKELSQISEIEYLLYLCRPRTKYYNSYYRTIKNWQAVFGKEAILVCFQEEIEVDPQSNIKRILSHIGALANHIPTEDLISRRINTTTNKLKITQKIPEPSELIKWAIAKQTFSDLIELNNLVGGSVDTWVKELEQIMKNGRLEWKLKYYFVSYILLIPEKILWFMVEFIRDIVLYVKVQNWLNKNEKEVR
ncbi:MAG: sulfotransferase [Crocosphaera sp.]|nr:sulfotransferase [Crocosphaera sp.]